MYTSQLKWKHLDYGDPIYNLAVKSVLSLLDTIQTSSLRLALVPHKPQTQSVCRGRRVLPLLPPTGSNLQLTIICITISPVTPYLQLNSPPSPLTLPGFA